MQMKPGVRLTISGALAILLSSAGVGRALTVPPVHPNPNTARAGVLRNGVLTVALEAKESLMQLEGAHRSMMTIEAFAEPGKAPLMPGPLIRAPQGTELRLSIRNTLPVALTLEVPATLRGGPGGAAIDSVVVAPGAVGHFDTRLTTAGNYWYRATTPTGAARAQLYAGLLAGALVVDSVGAPAQPNDRVLVIMVTGDSVWTAFADTADPSLAAPGRTQRVGGFVHTINGLSWPATERLHATVGDSLHWRILNASNQPHPMHLHGFYFRVDDYAGPLVARFGQPKLGAMEVTQLVSDFATMSISWLPNRAGNWLFHCHLAIHNLPYSQFGAPNDDAMSDMSGLVLGVEVADRPGIVASGSPTPSGARHIRLVAESGQANPGTYFVDTIVGALHHPVIPMRFVLEEGGRVVDGGSQFSPELDLVKGQPVAITVVNHLAEPTSVHWHGIEVEDSYVDGVPGFSGEGKRLTPAIAPGDSFVARFTPPRAGTFMYHAHVDEVSQQTAGMEGALIVRDPGSSDSAEDHVLFLKGLGGDRKLPLSINGRSDPDTLILHVGRRARFRLMNLSTVNVSPLVSLTARPDSAIAMPRDTLTVRWKPLAKDGFDMPLGPQQVVAARQILAVGETYDFEYTPRAAGTLRLEYRTNGGQHRLLIRVPIRVE